MPVTNKRKAVGRDAAVQGTNDSSVLSKVSAVAQGYFLDDYLKQFVFNESYYARWRAVDHCVKQFLWLTESCPRRQVLSLGAGFDSLYFCQRAEGTQSGGCLSWTSQMLSGARLLLSITTLH
uniref:Leucine carboxyl methyltransferase 1 homolog n=1 Tax=Salmo trutta TaxID=8032 RepID=A0A673XXR8_SALTR